MIAKDDSIQSNQYKDKISDSVGTSKANESYKDSLEDALFNNKTSKSRQTGRSASSKGN